MSNFIKREKYANFFRNYFDFGCEWEFRHELSCSEIEMNILKKIRELNIDFVLKNTIYVKVEDKKIKIFSQPTYRNDNLKQYVLDFIHLIRRKGELNKFIIDMIEELSSKNIQNELERVFRSQNFKINNH